MKKLSSVLVVMMVMMLLFASCKGHGGNIIILNPPVPPPFVNTPPIVTAVGGHGQVTVSWTEVPGADSFNLYWSIHSGVTITNGTAVIGATSPFVQNGLADNTTYYYIVTSVISGMEGAQSQEVSATTLKSSTIFGDSTVYRMQQGAISDNWYFSTVDSQNFDPPVAFIERYAGDGTQVWKALVVTDPGNFSGTDGMQVFEAAGYVSVFYTERDPGAIPGAPGTMKFVRFDTATGARIAGTETTVDRGAGNYIWNAAGGYFSLLYLKESLAVNSIGQVDAAGNLVSFQALSTSEQSLKVFTVDAAGDIFLAGNVTHPDGSYGLVTEKLGGGSSEFTDSDLNVANTLAASNDGVFLGGVINLTTTPTGVTFKFDLATGALLWLQFYPDESPAFFQTDLAGNLYGVKRNAGKLFQVFADGSPGGWEVSNVGGNVTATALNINTLAVATGSRITFFDRETGNEK